MSTTSDADLNWRTVFYTIWIAWIIDRLSYLEVSNVSVYLFMRKCRNNIQISSSHISSTDVIFTEVFDTTLDIYNVYNMLFWSPTFSHQLRYKVLTNLEIRRFFSISPCVYRKWRTNKLKVCEDWTNARLLSLQVSFVCLYSLLRKKEQ